MGHRLTRDAPTRARRIHATDDEWETLRSRAQSADRSMSAYIVQAALHPRTAPQHRVPSDAIRTLAAVDIQISALADAAEHTTSALDALAILAELERIADRVDGMAEMLGPGKA